MNQAEGSFAEISERCIRAFLHTVVVIDDQAFRSQGQPAERLVSPGLPSPSDEEETEQETPLPVSAPFHDGNAYNLNAEEVIRIFAKGGVLCAVLEPKDDADILPESMPAARRADAMILDWRIHDKDGDHALSVIKNTLKTDQEHSRRLRLILIYTAEPDLKKVFDRLCVALKDGGESPLTEDIDALALSAIALRIVVRAKPSGQLKAEWAKFAVPIGELPQHLIKEFALLTSGLVANVAIRSLAVLRDQTHALLAQMRPSLDAAYLTHRTLLPSPDDAVEHVADLVAGEITALLQAYEVGKVSDTESVKAWINQKNEYTLKGRKLSAENVFALVRDGCAALRWAGNEGSNSFSAIFGMSKRKVREHLTAMLAVPGSHPEDIDQQFTVLTSMMRRYEKNQPPPWLRLGTIVRFDQSPGHEQPPGATHLICVQPSCHSVRLEGKERAFLFAPSVSHNKVDLEQIVQEQGSFRKLKISLKSYEIEKITFIPNEAENIVRAQQQGNAYVFESKRGKYIWIGQLKDMYAQRLANRLATAISEVALNEYEWARAATNE